MRDSFILCLYRARFCRSLLHTEHFTVTQSPICCRCTIVSDLAQLTTAFPGGKSLQRGRLKTHWIRKRCKGEEREGQGVSFSVLIVFPLFRLCFFAVICYLSTLQQTVASSHELMKLLQQLLPPVRLRLGTRTRTFRKRFLNNFPGGCLTNFTGAVSLSLYHPRPWSSISLRLSLPLAPLAVLALPAGAQTRNAQSEVNDEDACVLFHFRHLWIVYIRRTLCTYTSIHIYLYIYWYLSWFCGHAWHSLGNDITECDLFDLCVE